MQISTKEQIKLKIEDVRNERIDDGPDQIRLFQTKEEIKLKIIECDEKIEEGNARIRLFQSQEEDLEQLRGRIRTMETEFGEAQQQREAKVRLMAAVPNSRLAIRYADGMDSMIHGPEFTAALDSFNLAINKINTKINEYEDNITEEENIIIDLKITKASLEELYTKAEAEGVFSNAMSGGGTITLM